MIGEGNNKGEMVSTYGKEGTDDLLIKLQLAEETAARQAAKLAVEEKKGDGTCED